MSNIEIERKFLVKDFEAVKKAAATSVIIRQGYLSDDPERTVRIRVTSVGALNNKHIAEITVKGKSSDDGLSRSELETQIHSASVAFEMLDICKTKLNKKRYYYHASDGFTWEIDEFENGLVLAEVELQCVTDKPEIPEFIGKEVTGDVQYYNSNIAK